MRALFATAQQPHSRDIFLNQKILPPDKFINQQEGIKVKVKSSMARPPSGESTTTESGVNYQLLSVMH